ncbi:hypothetical protein [Opitutus sp. ER46]|uniref:hypothetical protein n=1 Tax=Opitutus sp. ER46 TaxID=2161864 RepID=UPI000D3041E8|nr:hypothetical protein [Opitutus sp. ER46]PTX94612.1 hypothetical protein DB354_12845 [Opitutus sp. ER46]
MVSLSVGGLWLKWSLLSFNSCGWPTDFGLVMTVLFVVGVILAFSAAAVSSARWRRTMQVIAGFVLVAMVVIPMDVNAWLPEPKYTFRREDRFVSITGKPRIEDGQYAKILVLDPPETSEPSIRIYLSPEWASQLSGIGTAEFTLWRTREVLLPGWRVEGHVPEWRDTLETIRVTGQTLYDRRTCPVHHVTMQRMELPIHYGMPAYNDAWEKFSGGPGFVQGGCVVTPQRTAMGYRCPECSAEYEKWAAELNRKYAERSGSPAGPEKGS